MKCPVCHAENTRFRPVRENYICDDCDHVFTMAADKDTLRIFVSYGHDEFLPFSRHLAQQLNQRGHEIWFDEDRLKPGGDWETYIEEGIDWLVQDASRARLLLIMTPYSVRRPDGYCLNEIARALDCRLKIIPVMLVNCTPPLSIYRLQWLDMQNTMNKKIIDTQSFEADFEKICTALETDLLDTTGTAVHLKKVLEPLDFSTDIVFEQECFCGRQEIFHEIDQWLTQNNPSKIFWFTGEPGIGKTAIAIKLLQSYPHISAFFLCTRGHSEKSSPQRAICTIAYQLSAQIPSYREILTRIDIRLELERCNARALFDALIVQPLSHMIELPIRPLVILFDGVDEATQGKTNAIAEFIGSEFTKLPIDVRVILTSRSTPEVMLPLQSLKPHLFNSKGQSNLLDISEYIHKRLQTFSKEDGFDTCKQAILDLSEGIMLYAKYICDEITSGERSMFDIETLPKGLGAIYHRACSFSFANIDRFRKIERPLLHILCAAPDPITKKELSLLSDCDVDDVTDLLANCASLLKINGTGEIVSFHATFYEWLCDEQKAGLYYIDVDEGKCAIEKRLWELFTASDFNFFYDGKLQKQIFLWLPNLLKYHEGTLPIKKLAECHMMQIAAKGVDTINIFACYPETLRFTSELFRVAFGHCREHNFADLSIDEKFCNQITFKQLQILFESVRGIYKQPVPEKDELFRSAYGHSYYEYYQYAYFCDILLPELYVQASVDITDVLDGLEAGIYGALERGSSSTSAELARDYEEMLYAFALDHPDLLRSRLDAFADKIEPEEWDERSPSKYFRNLYDKLMKRKQEDILDT